MICKEHSIEELSGLYSRKGLPYTPEVNLPTLTNEIEIASQDICDLKESACPEQYAVVSLNMHPAFGSEKYYPGQLLTYLNLKCIGVQPSEIYPRFSMENAGTTLQEQTSKLYLAGSKEDIRNAPKMLKELDRKSFVADQACTVESFESISPYDKINVPSEYSEDLFLVGLFEFPGKTPKDSRNDFEIYAKEQGFKVNPDFNYVNDGMYYVLVKGKKADLSNLAEYALIYKIGVPVFEQDLYDELD